MRAARSSSLWLIVVLFWAPCLLAQIVSPMEMPDPSMRRLQQHNLKVLKEITSELNQHRFPYPFYFSRKLDLDEAEQKKTDQRSIRFDRYNNQTALEISGNYYAAYSNERMDADYRLRQTYLDVMLPILQIVVPHLQAEPAIDVFAIEVSHHVRRKVMGIDGEYPENVVVVIPRELAARIVQAHDLVAQQNLMLEADVYSSGQPTVLWLAGDRPVLPEDMAVDKTEPGATRAGLHSNASGASLHLAALSPASPAISNVPPELRATPLHDTPLDGLKALQQRYGQAIEKMTQEQNAAAHFVPYSPPAFITFKKGTYLQLAMTTTVDAGVADSQYKLAALAFDRHVAHLVRPVLGYFSGNVADFDGMDFSTTVKIAGDIDNAHALAVEFILPFGALNCFQQYDCTGQQLLNAGIVLINGERAGLELQAAEAK